MIIKELIEHLQKLDGKIEVWTFWDESGECFPIDTFPKIEAVAKNDGKHIFNGKVDYLYKDKPRWEYKSLIFKEATIFKEKEVLMI